MHLKRDGINRYRLVRAGNMRVDGLVYANEALRPLLDRDKSLVQLADAACLPGVLDPVVGMPDIHEGFGLPIGGVMAVAAGGIISAGAVGMDINCGVRLIRTSMVAADWDKERLCKLIERIEAYVPTGIGKKGRHKGITAQLFERVVHNGVAELVQEGFGSSEDLHYIEENGRMEGADLGAVSSKAIERGAVQLGTLGGGNHFIEIQEVKEVFDDHLGHKFGLFPGQLVIMIHTGSRGFGHQICTDYSRSLLKVAGRYGIELPSKGLACAPIDSPEGKRYYAAMACAVNFAFANRQIIMADICRALSDITGQNQKQLQTRLVYDVAHNIAKWEKHRNRRVLVHRKGATRALPAGHDGNPLVYRDTGHPVLVPGSMGTSSYVLVGTASAAESYYSVNHGAGRTLSRRAAGAQISRAEFEASMGQVIYNIKNYKDIVDEAPLAYKDIDQVVETLVEAGLTHKVARMYPLAVIKGKD
ncbi:MAG: RtcB family protein [Peptococcaceae bacterium]|nr:RtcB family protein [Peptococcaceae bacterium]